MVIHLSYILINILCVLYTNAQIVIKDAGTGRIQPTDIGMIFYLTLENICPSEMYISVRGVKCCEINSLTGAKDCESMKLLGGDPGILCAGKTKNVTLIYPNLYLYGRQGVCTVLVVFKVGLVTDHFFHKIPFNTKGSFQEFSIKRCPCYTADLDPFRNCTPVDCPIKYSGHRNYFNSLTKYCEPVPYCRSVPGCSMPEEMYDILHNRCVNIRCTVTRSDLSLIEDRRIPSCPVPYILGNMICHHGCVDKKTGECICFDKWLSTVSNEPEFVPSLISSHMCNIRTGSWTELNKDKLLLTILVMVVMTSLCVLKLFFLICILHFCYKWARSRAKGEKKSMTQFGFCKGYGTTCSEACSGHSKSSTKSKSKSKKSSIKSRCRSKDRSERNTCVQNIFEMPSRQELCCRSQGALAKARLSDKCLQLEIGHTCPDVGVIATVACACKEQTTERPTLKAASVQTAPSTKSNSKESFLSDESSSDSSSSVCSCESTDESVKRYRNDTNTYFTTTYTGFHSSTHKSKASSSGGNETTTQTISNFSINMEYDSEDLELECSSSSEK